MAGANLSPRQRMINMMYLVLTALLALNVSKEVLNSFFEVNKSIDKTTISIAEKNKQTYKAINDLKGKEARPYKDLANTVAPLSEDLVDLILEMKYNLVLEVDGEVYLGDNSIDSNGELIDSMQLAFPYDTLRVKFPERLNENIVYLNAKDNRNSSGDLFNPLNNKNLESNAVIDSLGDGLYAGENVGLASQLRVKIVDFRDHLLSILEQAQSQGLNVNGLESVISNINSTLEIKDDSIGYGENSVTWENYNFYDMPAVGALTLLSKWQADIQNIEYEVINFFAENINASSVSFSSVKATTIPSSNFILKGDKFSSEIFLTAFSETDKPEVYVGKYIENPDGSLSLVNPSAPLEIENGMGVYSVVGNTVGLQSYEGFIKIVDGNSYSYYPFEGEYLVADKSYTVTPTQMNVLYANDVENTIKVSVAGYQPEDIRVTFNSGSIMTNTKTSFNETIRKNKGEYIIKPRQEFVGKKVKVSLSVKKSDNTYQSLGNSEFRVKNVPGQTIGARYSDGTFSKNKIIANTFSSKIKDFDFPIKFYVSEFTVVTIGSKRVETKVKGFKLSDVARREVEKLEKGQTVLFKDFVVKQKGIPNYLDRPKDKFELVIE